MKSIENTLKIMLVTEKHKKRLKGKEVGAGFYFSMAQPSDCQLFHLIRYCSSKKHVMIWRRSDKSGRRRKGAT